MKRQTLFFLSFIIIFGSVLAQDKSNRSIFKDRYIKRAMKKAVFWQLENPKHDLYSWTNGVFYAGVFATYEITGSKKIYNAILNMGKNNSWKAGPRLFHADDYAICQTYIDVYRIENNDDILIPTIAKLDSFMTFPYEPPLSQVNIKKDDKTVWWWCDALFMAPPTLVKLGETLKDHRYLNLSDSLFKACYAQLYDKDEHLYARDLRFKWGVEGIIPLKESNGRKIFWSRGNGWVLGGLTRILKELPLDYPKRDFYIQNFKEMAVKIASLQQSDGLWRASLYDPDAYPGGEGSGSGLYCYALAWGINEGILDKSTFLPVVEKAWVALTKLQKKNGMVGWIQPVGADPRANFSSKSWEVYGTGAFLLAGSEVIKIDW